MPQPHARSYHHRHLDFRFEPTATGSRLTVHSAEVLRGVLGGDLKATGYVSLGSADLPEAVAQSLESAMRDLRTDLRSDLAAEDDIAPAAQTRRQRHLHITEQLEAFFTRHRDNPLVMNGVVVDPRSARGRQLVAQIRAGQAEPRLLADWVRLRIEWHQILDAF